MHQCRFVFLCCKVYLLCADDGLVSALDNLDRMSPEPPLTMAVLFRKEKQFTVEEMVLNRGEARPSCALYEGFLASLLSIPSLRGQAPLTLHVPTHMTCDQDTVERKVVYCLA